ncbi:DUF3010 family protein [Bosea sp. BIWAKO-01]|uniref:DUF3010 family protein n=1 Tax=Bosea sp. BIWAKO-01 TaxID=506668 RepID=UPI000853A4A9|nr:DUF3010 family protein [Bosea sp. BIWAKO-01]
MVVCGVELRSSEARLVLVTVKDGELVHVRSKTKVLKLGDDTSNDSIATFLQAVKTFAHENGVEAFAIKARAKTGQMAGGGITFKMEAIIQLSGVDVTLVNPVALSSFSKKNIAGIPDTINGVDQNAYLSGVFDLNRKKLV